MQAQLPPVAAIRAFEAAARNQSFTIAAIELNITQSAISHQIRHLEELWAVKLFKRGRRIELTSAGRLLLPVIRDFLENLTKALASLHSTPLADSLRVSTTQSFAVKWLVPRLPDFQAQCPHIALWITTGDQLANFTTDNVDVAIRLGHGHYKDMHSALLFREHVFPVCSQKFFSQMGPISGPEDLLKYPLLLRSTHEVVPNWEYWFRHAGLTNVKIKEGPRFPDTNMALQAALRGQGVALARSAHLSDELAAGRFVKLLNVQCVSDASYYVVYPSGLENIPKVAAFRDWMVKESARAQALYDRQAGTSGVPEPCQQRARRAAGRSR